MGGALARANRSVAHTCLLDSVMSANAREVLRLYRAILRRGQALRHTDRNYFRRTVSEEFKRWKGAMDPAEIRFQLEVNRAHSAFLVRV